jgi:hypothetical protein
MSESDLSADSPIGFEVLPEAEWYSHAWLSELYGASDSESDSAWFWTSLTEIQVDALKRIIVQHCMIDGAWENAATCEGSFFPSRDWVQASWGWFLPFFAAYGEYETRALIPNGWKSPGFEGW